MSEYESSRRTPRPSDPSTASFALRYAVLRHVGHGPEHFDLLLETAPGQPLRALQLPQWPPAGEGLACRELAPHRPLYLDYEGEVSGGRGSVTRIEHGRWSGTPDDFTLQPANAKPLRLVLAAGQLKAWPGDGS